MITYSTVYYASSYVFNSLLRTTGINRVLLRSIEKRSVALYYNESLTFWKREKEETSIFRDVGLYGRMLKVGWIEILNNEEALRGAGKDINFLKHLKKNKRSVNWTHIEIRQPK